MELLSRLTLTELLGLQLANNLARYLLFAGLSYFIFWRWGFQRFRAYFLYLAPAKKKDLLRELGLSILSIFIFLFPTVVVVSLKDFGLNRVYLSLSAHSFSWYVVSFFIVFFLHDTYFYWTHRLMHHRVLYRWFHRAHHLSVEPTPFAAYAFHPLEAMVEGFLFLLIPLLMPVHISVIVFFTLFSLFMNIYGHLGFNFFSAAQLKKFPLNLISHSTHHSWHHRYHQGNYGFYLQFWDRLMGTWRGELK